MNPTNATNERSNFADRLRTALSAAKQPTGFSAFARAYNLRAAGATVTAHAGRKWLVGEAIPTHEKILIIAKWLNVPRCGYASVKPGMTNTNLAYPWDSVFRPN